MLGNYTYIFKPVILACLIALLISCGFRLRGGGEVPAELKSVHIAGIAEYEILNQELKRALQRAGSIVTNIPGDAQSIINISGEETKKRVLSVDTQGRAAEYELNYRFSFSVTANNSAGVESESNPGNAAEKSPDQTVLVPFQQIKLTRDFRFDPNNVLATGAVEKQLQSELVRFAVRQMLRRIQSHLNQPQVKLSGQSESGQAETTGVKQE